MNNFSVFPVLQFFLLFFFMLYSFCTLPPGKTANKSRPWAEGKGEKASEKGKDKKGENKKRGENEADNMQKKERERGRWQFLTPCWQRDLMRVTKRAGVEEKMPASDKSSTSVQEVRRRGRVASKTSLMQLRSSF